jgi:hypothetical protein
MGGERNHRVIEHGCRPRRGSDGAEMKTARGLVEDTTRSQRRTVRVARSRPPKVGPAGTISGTLREGTM